MRTIPRWLTAATALALVGAVLLLLPAATAAPSRPATVSGTVYDAAGNPLARALVTAYALPGQRPGCAASPDEWRAVGSTTTGSTGAYTIAGLVAGSYRIGVVPKNLTVNSFGYRLSSNYADASADDVANVTSWVGFADDVAVPASGVDVRLALPASFSGTITDAATGAGIPGIEVRAVTTYQWQRIAPVALTDPYGRYTMAGLPLGAPDPTPGDGLNDAQRYGPVLVDMKGWYGIWLWWFEGVDTGQDHAIDLTQPGPHVYDWAMTRGGRLAVDVVDPAGRPVKGLAVTLDSAFPWPPQLTNAKGKAFVGVGADRGTVAVLVQDYAGKYRSTWSGDSPTWSTALKIPFDPSQDNQVTITVRPDAARIVGTVAFWSGVPLRDVFPTQMTQLTAVLPGATWNDWQEQIGWSWAHCDGTFEVSGLWPGVTTDLLVTEPDETEVRTATFTPVSGVNYLGTQRLPAWMYQVSVYDAVDNPIAGATVELWHPVDGSWEPLGDPTATATTDDGGWARVWLPWEPWEELRLYVSGNGLEPGFFQEPESLIANPDEATPVIDPNGYDRVPFDVGVRATPVP